MIWAYGFGAALAAVSTEAYYRNTDTAWGLAWPGIIGALVTNALIYMMLRHGTMIALAVVFSLFTAALRIGYTLVIGDSVSPGTWAAFGLVVLASVVKGVVK